MTVSFDVCEVRGIEECKPPYSPSDNVDLLNGSSMNFFLKLTWFFAVSILFSMQSHATTWEQPDDSYLDDWELTDAKYFSDGDLRSVRRILNKTKYAGEKLALAFNFAAESGNVELTKYLDSLGWIKACKKLRDCQPVQRASMNKANPSMVEWLLGKGFKSDSAALLSAVEQNLPQDDKVANSFAIIKMHCENGVNPLVPLEYEKKIVDASILKQLTDRQQSATQDEAHALLHARARATEAITTSFFKAGLCKKGAKKTIWFDEYLNLVSMVRAGIADLSTANAFINLKVAQEWRTLVESYLIAEAISMTDDVQRQKMLLAFKVDAWLARCRQSSTCSALEVAAESGADRVTFEILANEKFNLDSLNTSGATPISYATVNAHFDAVKTLCDFGADYRQTTSSAGYEGSIISLARRAYSYTWCGAALNAQLSNEDRESVRNRCTDVFDSIGSPQTAVTIDECVPGKSCLGIAFPPKGGDQEVKDLESLAGIFNYLKSGQCKAAKVTLSCTVHTKPYAVLIADKVQLRTAANANSGKIETLPFGTLFEVIDSKRACETVGAREGRWIKVKVGTMPQHEPDELNNLSGWIFDAYVDYRPSMEP